MSWIQHTVDQNHGFGTKFENSVLTPLKFSSITVQNPKKSFETCLNHTLSNVETIMVISHFLLKMKLNTAPHERWFSKERFEGVETGPFEGWLVNQDLCLNRFERLVNQNFNSKFSHQKVALSLRIVLIIFDQMKRFRITV